MAITEQFFFSEEIVLLDGNARQAADHQIWYARMENSHLRIQVEAVKRAQREAREKEAL